MFTPSCPCATYRYRPCFMPHKAHSSLEPALGHEMPPLWQVASQVFIHAIGCNITFQLGIQLTSNIQCSKVRSLVGSGKHSGHICWVMYAVTSRAVWGVQLLSNKMEWGAFGLPRASQHGTKWRAMISVWYFWAFDVPLICTSSVVPY